MKVLGFIPCRYDYEDFPGKALGIVRQKTLIRHSYENAVKAGFSNVTIVSNHETIKRHATTFNANVQTIDLFSENEILNSCRAFSETEKHQEHIDGEYILNIPFYDFSPSYEWLSEINFDKHPDIVLLVTDAAALNTLSKTGFSGIKIKNDKAIEACSNTTDQDPLFSGFILIKSDIAKWIAENVNEKDNTNLLNTLLSQNFNIQIIKSKNTINQVFTYEDIFKII